MRLQGSIAAPTGAILEKHVSWRDQKDIASSIARELKGKALDLEITNTEHFGSNYELRESSQHGSSDRAPIPESPTPHPELDAAWHTFKQMKLSLTLAELLQIAPYCSELFHHQIMTATLAPNVNSLMVQTSGRYPRVVDEEVPVISIKIQKMTILGVIVDGGSGGNIISEEMADCLDYKVKPSPFRVRMANQRPVQPRGMLKDVVILIGGIYYTVTFIILTMKQHSYPILLGRPWLRSAQVLHDWGIDDMVIKRDGQCINIPTNPRKILSEGRPKDLEVSK